MTESTAPAGVRHHAHDLIVGGLGGFAIGMFIGMFLAARVSLFESITFLPPLVAVVGAVGGVALLKWSHHRNQQLANPLVVTFWVLSVVAAVMVAGVLWAVMTFN